ncbi:MAG: GAF domain-containing protein [Myxococcota bacterium]
MGIPADEGGVQMTMVVEADHWMSAWRRALAELGEDASDESQVTCRICADGSVEVFAGREGRHLRVRSLEEDGAQVPPPRDRSLRDTVPESRPRGDARGRGRRRRRRRPTRASDPLEQVPYAAAFDGGEATSTEQALAMLARHVPAEAALYLHPDADRRGWRVEAAHGAAAKDLPGALLHSRETLPGPLTAAPGRRTFSGEGVDIRFEREPGDRAHRFRVKSALWAPVRAHGEIRGLLLVLNARRDRGFVDGEISAVRELATVLASRLGSRAAVS